MRVADYKVGDKKVWYILSTSKCFSWYYFLALLQADMHGTAVPHRASIEGYRCIIEGRPFRQAKRGVVKFNDFKVEGEDQIPPKAKRSKIQKDGVLRPPKLVVREVDDDDVRSGSSGSRESRRSAASNNSSHSSHKSRLSSGGKSKD